MDIAIMGAGLSGLSCAITLEKYGVTPTIFENRSTCGDRFVNGEAVFNVLDRPINNCLQYFVDKYDIHLKPTNPINEMVFHSKNEVGKIEGNLGIINIRGRHEDSFEKQLQRQVKCKINFNSNYSYEDLKKDFSHVVLAPGDGDYAVKLNNYRKDLTYSLKGATVEGNFSPTTAETWFNSAFVPKGYAYMLPFSATEANIVIAYPDYPENIEKDIEELWKLFFEQVSKDTNQELRITDGFQIRKYVVGICEKPKIDNTYFVGNCFGTISPALGFGQFTAVLTGIYAAYDMLNIGVYEYLTKSLYENYNNSLILRRSLENFEDKTFDFLFKNLDNNLTNNLIDKLFGDGTDKDILKWISLALKPYAYIKSNHYCKN